jgi:hypothetical protein
MLVSFICVHLSIQFMKSKFKQKQDLIFMNLNIFLGVMKPRPMGFPQSLCAMKLHLASGSAAAARVGASQR